MKTFVYIKFLAFVFVAFAITSCMDGDDANFPPDGSKPFLMMTNNEAGGPLVNSGKRYFPAQALLLDPTAENDTMVFAVTLQGVASLDKDINVSLSMPEDALDDFLGTDSIDYQMLPSDKFELLSTSGVISKGTTYTTFTLVLHPSLIDLKQNYMLPIAVSTSDGIQVSSNYGMIYYHMIGNPIAGLYEREFIRYGNPAGTGSPDIHTFTDQVMAPVNGTTVTTPTGYYTGPDYIITFDDDGLGNLTNFKAVLDPAALAADWDPAGISVTSGPTITVNGDYTVFTVKYTTKTRNVTDIYTKK
jgi:hypothetical protein